MMAIDLTNEKQRSQVPYLLAKSFTDEIKMLLFYYKAAQRIELINYFIEQTALLEGLYQDGKVNLVTWEAYRQKEDELAERFGSAITPYEDTDLLKYLNRETVLVETELVDADTFKQLPAEVRILSENEFCSFVQLSRALLMLHRRFLFTLKAPHWEAENPDVKPTDNPEAEEQDKEVTRARQLLLVYYLLKGGYNIDRQNTDMADVARFIHALFGIKLSTLPNSDIYKKYRRIPEYRKGLPLIEDLYFVRNALAHLKVAKAIELVDAAIAAETEKLGGKLK